jgi:hypothetical protein
MSRLGALAERAGFELSVRAGVPSARGLHAGTWRARSSTSTPPSSSSDSSCSARAMPSVAAHRSGAGALLVARGVQAAGGEIRLWSKRDGPAIPPFADPGRGSRGTLDPAM